jgi:hypothetical protein
VFGIVEVHATKVDLFPRFFTNLENRLWNQTIPTFLHQLLIAMTAMTSQPLCLKRCMPSTNLNELLLPSHSDNDCGFKVDSSLFLDDESMTLRKRQRITGSSLSLKSPATEALETFLSDEEDFFVFDLDFDHNTILKVPFVLAAASKSYHFKSSHETQSLSDFTCGFSRLTTTSRTA